MSLSVRRAWIEIFHMGRKYDRLKSLSVRRAWIEILFIVTKKALDRESLSVRRAWIEISVCPTQSPTAIVALREESVD